MVSGHVDIMYVTCAYVLGAGAAGEPEQHIGSCAIILAGSNQQGTVTDSDAWALRFDNRMHTG